jgi:hypothetical protein
MVECWVICLAAIHTPNGSSTVQLIMSVVYGDEQSHIGGGSDHCACLTGSDVTGSHMTFSPTFFPVFSRTFFLYFFFVLFFPVFYFSYFSPVFPSYFSVLFSRTFSKVATFEIQRLKISVSCFSSTCRYQTVHVPCEISIQTSPVGLPLDGWDSRMRDLKGPKMNLLKAKED